MDILQPNVRPGLIDMNLALLANHVVSVSPLRMDFVRSTWGPASVSTFLTREPQELERPRTVRSNCTRRLVGAVGSTTTTLTANPKR